MLQSQYIVILISYYVGDDNMKLLAILLSLIMCICAASAFEVKLNVPENIKPNESFNISVDINELPAVVGVALDLPVDLAYVSCSTPNRVVGNTLFIAIINTSSVECTFKAESEGKFKLSGSWINTLSGDEGKFETEMFVGGTGVVRTQPSEVTAELTATTTTTTEISAKETPGFEVLLSAIALSAILLRRCRR